MDKEAKKKFIKKYGPTTYKQFVNLYYQIQGTNKMKFIAWRCGMSRKTVYNWVNRLFDK